jgi:hypothetical protein
MLLRKLRLETSKTFTPAHSKLLMFMPRFYRHVARTTLALPKGKNVYGIKNNMDHTVRMSGYGLDSSGSEQGPEAGPDEHGNERQGTV